VETTFSSVLLLCNVASLFTCACGNSICMQSTHSTSIVYCVNLGVDDDASNMHAWATEVCAAPHVCSATHIDATCSAHRSTRIGSKLGIVVGEKYVLKKDQVAIRWLLLTENDLIKHASGRYISIYIYVPPAMQVWQLATAGSASPRTRW